MFEELSTGPLGKLSDLIYRWRGIDSWPTATATVYTCEFRDGGRGPDFYVVTFSYRAGGELQDGSYYEQGSAGSPPFQPGDTFNIKWNPKHPNRFHK
ncbi:MAG TPA: DUF3592 domain-containing protein [Acidobacteriaceae bacterium]|nr:DUF3592 domain-containing protein [Acidobacteriaceae bacterium]